jgi:hypothetical protein
MNLISTTYETSTIQHHIRFRLFSLKCFPKNIFSICKCLFACKTFVYEGDGLDENGNG